jgi:serine/threonine-protein kinase
LDAAQLEAVAAVARQTADLRALGRELARGDVLTRWQINRIFQGKAPDLLLGSYVLLEELGEGGMGTVYKARNWKLGRIVAVKVIRKERLDSEAAIRRFRREIQAAGQLWHPNIVRALDADEVNGMHFFVMEYVEGRDLSRLVKERGPLPVPQACDYIRQAALGLQHAFERGLIHRDIKSSNLLLMYQSREIGQSRDRQGAVTAPLPVGRGSDQDPVVKLLDMGLARFERAEEHSSTLTQEGTIMGTPDYIAPEQARDSHHADIRADIYSLGCTLYYLLTGRVPFPGGTLTEKLLKHQMDTPTPVRRLRPEVPDEVAGLIEKLMAKRPEDRFQTPAELAAALDTILASVGSQVPSGSRETSDASPRTLTSSATHKNPFADIDLPGSGTIAARPPPRRSKTVSPRSRPLVAAIVVCVLLSSAVVLGIIMAGRKESNTSAETTPAKNLDEPKPSKKQSQKEKESEEAKKREQAEGQRREGKESATPPDNDAEFFNGKDLTGWEGLTEYWFVRQDGALVGTNGDKAMPFSTFLCSRKKYTDFELKFEVRLSNGEGNSGVQIRSELFDREKFAVRGPQCNIGQQFWGSFYGEEFGGVLKQAPDDVVKKAIKPREFNDYYIKCVGKHITIKLNGETTVDDDFPGMPEEGIIAWQLHGGYVMEVTFKNIQFTNLRIAKGPPRALSAEEAKKQQADDAKRLGVPVQMENSIGMKLNLIPAGRFLMGSPEDEPGRQGDEFLHEVEITMPFIMGTCELAVGQFRAFVKDTDYKTVAEKNGKGAQQVNAMPWDATRNWHAPGLPQGDEHPIACLARSDVEAFCQ